MNGMEGLSLAAKTTDAVLPAYLKSTWLQSRWVYKEELASVPRRTWI